MPQSAEYKLITDVPIHNTATLSSYCNMNCIYVPEQPQMILKEMCKNIENIEDYGIMVQARHFCNMLSDGLANDHSNIVNLPHMYCSIEEDETYFEWPFDTFRMGFLFCNNPDESGWFIVSKKEGHIERFESSFKKFDKKTMDFILDFIRGNA